MHIISGGVGRCTEYKETGVLLVVRGNILKSLEQLFVPLHECQVTTFAFQMCIVFYLNMCICTYFDSFCRR